MNMVLLRAGVALGCLMVLPALANASGSLFPTVDDKAICDPIFSDLAKAERGLLVAQAEPSKEATEKRAGEKTPPVADEEDLTNALSAMLQACSYDGKALTVPADAMKAAPEPEGSAAVDRIMRFTGLPQNFTIVESDVPNAAAMIVVGADGIPKRVIAYSKPFMQGVARATGESDWPGTSILAHEIGHHLSGHTLVPGGSQPPIELEADTFSGFVLFKMGATLPQAEKAIATLIPEADGPTHPGRLKRLAAVAEGWQQSCEQQVGSCSDTTVAVVAEQSAAGSDLIAPDETKRSAAAAPAASDAKASSPRSGTTAMPHIPGPADIDMPDPNGVSTLPSEPLIDRIPRLAADATPSKFDRFVYDEVGVFDPRVRERLERTAFQFAAAANVEIVTIVVKDLRGRAPDAYAIDAMRQLRVGKLDVGNGAVLVIAPGTGEIGVALGPGLLVEYDSPDALKGSLNAFLNVVAGGGRPQAASSLIADTSYRIMRDTRALEWSVRYASLDQMGAADGRRQAEREKSGVPFDVRTDPTFRKLSRLDATIVSLKPDENDRTLMVNEPRSRHVGPAMHVRTAEGRDVVLYVNKSVPALMPVPLEEGRRYAFIARKTILKTGAPQLDLISYDRLD